MCALAPEAIAAPLQNVIDPADARIKGLVDLSSLSFAVAVPVFGQLRDWDGSVIARECETHNGLHLIEGTDARIEQGELWIDGRGTGLAGSISQELCECGAEAAVLEPGGVAGGAGRGGLSRRNPPDSSERA